MPWFLISLGNAIDYSSKSQKYNVLYSEVTTFLDMKIKEEFQWIEKEQIINRL